MNRNARHATPTSRRRLLLPLLCLLASIGASPAWATHFRYGHITWTNVPAGSNTVAFTIQDAWRRDGFSQACVNPATGTAMTAPTVVPCTGPGGAPGNGDVFFETVGTTQFDFGDGSPLLGSPVNRGLLYKVTSIDATNNWMFAFALDPNSLPSVSTTIQHTYASAGPKTAKIDDTARISHCVSPNAHINNPDAAYRLQTIVNVGAGNSSPVSGLLPIILCPQNGLCTFTVPASDSDPVSFRMSTLGESGLVAQPGPPQCPNAASIGSTTGVYTWNTTGCVLAGSSTGSGGCGNASLNTLYSTQVMIEEANGSGVKVPLDFLIQLVPACQLNTGPSFNSPTPACGSTISVNANSLVTFSVNASDPNAGDLVSLNAAGIPAGASMLPALPTSANPVSSTFSWTPPSNQVGQHIVNFSAADPCGVQALCSVTIDVKPVCGNSLVETGEQCDQGAANGTTGSCCSASCTLNPMGTLCRASAGECDPAETCSGSSPTCPADVKSGSGTSCTSDGNVCTVDQCDGSSSACQHPAGNGGTLCRAGSGDTCDPDEFCTGSSTNCPADAKKSASFVCRAAVDDCDKAEKCTGVAGQPCPADSKQSAGASCPDDGNVCTTDTCNGTSDACQHAPGNAGTVCRAGSGDVCDPSETCDGSSANCPTDVKQDSTFVCRLAAGECDQAETCTGTAGQKCPATDAKKANGTLCTDDGNPCTTDTCNGSSNSCQHHAGNAGTVCRAGSGDVCDPDELCTGSSSTCPGNVVQPATLVCRAAAGECDQAETCPGIAGQQCPGDAKKSSGTTCTDDSNPCTLDQCDGSNVTCQHPVGNAGAVCRAAVGPCDVAETCSGSNANCPADGLAPSGTVCRPIAGACDVVERCTGSSPACPTDAFDPSGFLCRAASTSCDPPEHCTGSSASCPIDENPDADCDGILNGNDNCVLVANPDQKDTDHDRIGDACDNCVNVFNPAQSDQNHDGIGDICSQEVTGTLFTPTHVCMRTTSQLTAPGNGLLIVQGLLDGSALPDGLESALFSDGLALGISGGGLPEIETMMFAPQRCLKIGRTNLRCTGDQAEVATFRRQLHGTLYKVRITAGHRSFPAPLNRDGVTVVLSIGGLDLQFEMGGCILLEGYLVRCKSNP